MAVRNSYYQLMMTLVLIWATMGLSWNVLSGYSGMISFGQAAFFGLGGYTMTIAFVKFGVTPWIGIPLGAVVGVLAGIVIGLPTFRLRGHYFALSMLAYPLAMLYVFEWMGYQEMSLPMKREAPALYAQFQDPRVYIALAMALLVVAMLISLRVERSRFGRSLLAIKQNEPAAEAAGIDALRQKMYAIMLSGGIAAAAGGLYANVLLVVTPHGMFGMLVSAQALIMALFGGVGTLWGPVIGATVLVPLSEILHGELGHIIPGIQGVVYGLAIIIIILLAPEGIYWRVRDYFAAKRAPSSPAPAPVVALAPQSAQISSPLQADTRTIGGAILTLEQVTRTFGGLRAVDDVSLAIKAGSIHGIIGPNGAGKTTLFNVINGFLAPAAGTIRFEGAELVGLKPHQICRRGIGRSFQVVRAFPRMTVLENVITGAYVGAATDTEARALALEALARVGLVGAETDAIAGGLTTRQLRLMELARALAPRPRLLLLDETLAGLAHDALEDLLRIIQQVNREGTTIVIIEHTMQAMVKLADEFSVLDHGRLIASGPPAEVVRDRAVIEAYLGKKWMERAENPLS
ncbi:MAG: ATP-binding cassette domain-containing protein [Betaproteobacteria bacterium]|nr:ATP-binding cassette domain-containing protein [Betaproteobacteria bacterium]MSQ88594.1 ATP-binding cassette domain-containing protein [Betaproteobacteria bacterium]